VGYHEIDGKKRGFLFSIPGDQNPAGVFADIDSIVDTSVLTQQGWDEFLFSGINDLGVIVGEARNPDGARIGFLIDSLSTVPAIEVIPAIGTDYYARRINNFGDVVGRAFYTDGTTDAFVHNSGIHNTIYGSDLSYAPTRMGFSAVNGGLHINNSREVLVRDDGNGSSWYRYNLVSDSFTTQPFPNQGVGYFNALNDNGQVCGAIPGSVSGNGRNRIVTPDKACRYSGTDVEWEADLDEDSFGGALNNSGDVVGTLGNPLDLNCGFVYRNEIGLIRLDDLVEFGSQDDSITWQNWFVDPQDISDRNETGFGTIIGRLYGGGESGPGFVLVPTQIAPTAGIQMDSVSGLTTTEQGAQASFNVVLNTEPTADVTIGLSSSNTNEGTVDQASLTFTAANWDVPQTVTISGVDDTIEDGDVAYTIITSAASSSDPDYNGLEVDDVSVVNLDDDGPITYSSTDTPLDIPDNDPAGISSEIPVGGHTFNNLTVNVDISHPRPSDLEVYLIGPNGGPAVQLFNFTGDNVVANFNGTSSAGFWTLMVYDTRNRRTGTLNSWSITVEE
jgi:hypothetical protein